MHVRSRRYRVPAVPFEVTTEDGLRILGHRLGSGPTAVVFCHGFLGWHTKAPLVPFQEALAERATVYSFDFRGHGGSDGVSTFGVEEYLDVDAVVARARADGFRKVMTVGGSMGGIAVIRHGALRGGIELVAAISTPARWDGHTSRAVRRLMWMTGTRPGHLLARAWGTRTVRAWDRCEDPADLVERVAPIPLLIVHGRDDHFFDEENAWTLYRGAGHPKKLFLASRFGHAEDGYSPAFASQLLDAAEAMLGRPGEARPVEGANAS